MGKTQKTITLALWFVVVLGLVALVALQQGRPRDARAAASMPPELSTIFVAPPFRLIDSKNQPFGSEELKGKVWVFRLFFSRCTGVCPGTTALFRDIDESLDDPRLQIVSVSVDPGNDTPEVLHEYMERLNAKHPERWHLLTGDYDSIKDLARLMQTPFENAIDHPARFILVDENMNARGTYATQDGDGPGSVKALIADAKVLLEKGS